MPDILENMSAVARQSLCFKKQKVAKKNSIKIHCTGKGVCAILMYSPEQGTDPSRLYLVKISLCAHRTLLGKTMKIYTPQANTNIHK